MKRISRLGTIAVTMLIGVDALAQGQAGDIFYRRTDDCSQELIQAVGLTTAQQAALAALRQQTADSSQPIFDQLAALRQQIDTALASASADPCAIGNLETQAYGLRADIRTSQKNAEAAFVASLSADQQAKYAAFIAANPPCAAFPSGPPRLVIGHPGV